ncbi:hypothetical protein GIB67_004276 [Kingdonia uniflora]|uniref:Uncharacterized protein n=1 Tax=Kingdonia uniflora TaxID=39325 RepID=A0A7J7MRL1_9MAGN|nr:hypothetical protein GIB67_004276 [Kingdonia uniflora]
MSDLLDLLCDEDVRSFNEQSNYNYDYSQNSAFFIEIEDSIVELVEGEGDFAPEFDSSARFQSQLGDDLVRQEFVSWILKVTISIDDDDDDDDDDGYYGDATNTSLRGNLVACVNATYGLQPLTACLSVSYLDRYLASQVVPEDKGWVLQLVCVACFSLAAKLEESRPPTFRQLKGECEELIPDFNLESIYDAEIHVLSALDWRMRSVTPFTFIDFFAKKVDSTGTATEFLISRATNLILTTIKEISILDYWPSSMAAGAILIAAREVPKLSPIGPENALIWCHGLNKDRIEICYELLQDIVVGNTSKEWMKKRPKVPPHLNAMTGSETISSGSSPCSTSVSNRKRKLEFNDKDTLDN